MSAPQSESGKVGRDLVAARIARLRAELAAAPFDAVLLTSPEAVDYATGYRSVAGQLHRGPGVMALVQAERTVLVAPAADTAPAIEAGVSADDVVPYGRFYFAGNGPATAMSDRHASQAEALRVALDLAGPGELAVEGSALAPVASEVADGPVQDADSWMLGVRAVKLPGEQDLLRRAAELAEDGIEAALAIAKPGITERELATAVATAMVSGGGVPRFVVVTAGARSPLADAFPSGNACQPGDLLRFDVGCQLEGYWSDIARTAVIGEPTDLQQRRYDALLAGVEEEFAVARPGSTAGEVFDTAVRRVEDAGLRPYHRHHAGHAIGLSVYEAPVVRPNDMTVLASGMVFCLETPYYELGWGGMMVEDTGLVTDSGFELFTSIDRSLRVVAA
ncbi:MAG: Xaa-Pro dipeptidase [Pseudonocardia sp.]